MGTWLENSIAGFRAIRTHIHTVCVYVCKCTHVHARMFVNHASHCCNFFKEPRLQLVFIVIYSDVCIVKAFLLTRHNTVYWPVLFDCKVLWNARIFLCQYFFLILLDPCYSRNVSIIFKLNTSSFSFIHWGRYIIHTCLLSEERCMFLKRLF